MSVDPAPPATRLGRRAWTAVAVLVLAIASVLAVRALRWVPVALVLALFPAALLSPAAQWLKQRRVPASLAALLVVVALLGSVVLTGRLVAPAFAAQVAEVADAASEALERLERWAQDSSLPIDVSEPEALLTRMREAFSGGDLADRGLALATMVVDVVSATLLGVVALFFYLRDGRRLWRGVVDLLPDRVEHDVEQVAGRVWWTLGAYLRGQLLIAVFDAVFIGLGLLLLGVPLALPLAVIVFFGALFPIVGAFVSGLLAVLVGLADSGLTTGLLVLGLVLLVQQVEGNVLQPLVLSRVIALHPFVVIVSIAAGAVLLGVLGAFLAVPVTASIARAVDYLRDRTPDAGPGSDDDTAGDDGGPGLEGEVEGQQMLSAEPTAGSGRS